MNGKYLRLLRNAVGLDVATIAKSISCSTRMIHLIETDKRKSNRIRSKYYEMLCAIAKEKNIKLVPGGIQM